MFDYLCNYLCGVFSNRSYHQLLEGNHWQYSIMHNVRECGSLNVFGPHKLIGSGSTKMCGLVGGGWMTQLFIQTWRLQGTPLIWATHSVGSVSVWGQVLRLHILRIPPNVEVDLLLLARCSSLSFSITSASLPWGTEPLNRKWTPSIQCFHYKSCPDYGVSLQQ